MTEHSLSKMPVMESGRSDATGNALDLARWDSEGGAPARRRKDPPEKARQDARSDKGDSHAARAICRQ